MKREIRSSAIVGTAAVGSIIDVGRESFLTPGIHRWFQYEMRPIHLPRITNRIGKSLKKLKDDKPTQRTWRFPRSLFCESCRSIVRWKTQYEEEDEQPKCPECGKRNGMVPMRYVVACKNGHMEDFPWGNWAHSAKNANMGCRSRDTLKFEIDAGSGESNLDALVIKCTVCGSRRSLEGIASPEVTRSVTGKCRGHHPWIYDPEECEETPQALQRGAANLYYVSTMSALDIPAIASEDGNDAAVFVDAIRADPLFATMKTFLASATGETTTILNHMRHEIAQRVGCTEEVVETIVRSEIGNGATGEQANSTDELEQSQLLLEELAVLSEACRAGRMDAPNFVAVREELPQRAPAWVRRLVKSVLLIERLREVRIFRGFNRIDPSDQDRMVPPDKGGQENWLPASEIFGEGLFLSLNRPLLDAWMRRLPATEATNLAALENNRSNENFWFLPKVSASLLVVHSFSHLLLRQLSFECGYAAAALRERIYVDEAADEVGLLIYTSEGDADGSLGGLVRQGRSDRIVQTILDAVEQGRWCSADPVCSETAGQGLGGLNRAACHACVLIAETSCVLANSLLDRRYLVDENWGLVSFAEKLES